MGNLYTEDRKCYKIKLRSTVRMTGRQNWLRFVSLEIGILYEQERSTSAYRLDFVFLYRRYKYAVAKLITMIREKLLFTAF